MKHHGESDAISLFKNDLFAPLRIEEVLLVKTDNFLDQPAKRCVGTRFHRSKNAAKERWKFPGAQGDSCDYSQAATSSTFDSPKELRIGAGIGDSDDSIGSDDFSLEQGSGGSAVVFGKAAKPAPLNEASDTDSGAAASLNVLPRFCCDRFVSLHPDGTGTQGNSGLSVVGTALPHERIMEEDIVHGASPDQERVGRVGGALVTVSAAFDDEAQIIFAGEIDGSYNVGGLCSGDSINAGGGDPGIGPARGLGQGDLIAEIIRIF